MMFYDFGNGSQELSLHQKLPTPKQLYFYILWIGCKINMLYAFHNLLMRYAAQLTNQFWTEKKSPFSVGENIKSNYFRKIIFDFPSDANSAVNPLIYALHHSEFKQVTIKISALKGGQFRFSFEVCKTSGVH